MFLAAITPAMEPMVTGITLLTIVVAASSPLAACQDIDTDL